MNQQSRLTELSFSGFIVSVALLSLWRPAEQAFAPDLGTVNLSQIEAGKLRKSHYYAQISGYVNGPTVDRERDKQGIWRYIPLRSSSTSQSPVSLVVACRVQTIAECITQNPQTQLWTAQGYVVPDNEERDVNEHLAQKGVTFAKKVKYMKPEFDRGKAQLMTLLTTGILVMTVGSFLKALLSR